MPFEDLPEGYNDDFAQMCGEFAERCKENKTGEKRARREAAARARREAQKAAEGVLKIKQDKMPVPPEFSFEKNLTNLMNKMAAANSRWIKFKSDEIILDNEFIKPECMAEVNEAINSFTFLLHLLRLPNYTLLYIPQKKMWLAGIDVVLIKKKTGGDLNGL